MNPHLTELQSIARRNELLSQAEQHRRYREARRDAGTRPAPRARFSAGFLTGRRSRVRFAVSG